MSKKRSALLSAIVILAIVWIIQLVQNSNSGVEILKLKIPATEFIIQQPGVDDITLLLKDSVPADSKDPDGKKVEEWTINNGKTAGSSHIETLKNVIGSIKVLGTVSSSNDIERYELDATHAITIIAKAGDKTLRTLVLGKKSTAGSQTYAQIDGSSDIVVISGVPGSDFPLTEDNLLPPPPKKDDDNTATSDTNKNETANTSAQTSIKSE
jgi:hypothetical protein